MKIDVEKLKLEMAKKCFSSSDLMAAADISKTTYLNILKGKEVKPVTVGRIAKGLNVPVEELI